jgi:hypothetical protein
MLRGEIAQAGLGPATCPILAVPADVQPRHAEQSCRWPDGQGFTCVAGAAAQSILPARGRSLPGDWGLPRGGWLGFRPVPADTGGRGYGMTL